MHQAGNVIFAFGFYGNHIPSLADGNDRLSQELGIGRGRNNFLQTVTDFSGLDAFVPPDIRQGRRSRIGNFLLRENGAENPVFQVFVGSQGVKQAVQHCFGVILGYKAFDVPGAAQNACNAHQLYRLQASAPVGPFQAGGNIGHIPKGGISLPGAKVGGGGGLLQKLPDGIQIGLRGQPQAGRLAPFASGALGQHFQNLAQFQLCQGFFI